MAVVTVMMLTCTMGNVRLQ